MSKFASARVTTVLIVIFLMTQPSAAAPRGADGELRIMVVDGESSAPIPARLHLKNSRGRTPRLRLPEAIEFGDHIYLDGEIALPLRAGQYTFELEASPEYRTQSGHFEIERHADDKEVIEMRRFADLAQEGWWGGDLDVSRKMGDMPLATRAEGIWVVPIITSQYVKGKWSEARGSRAAEISGAQADVPVFGPFAQLDERTGGALLIFNLSSPLDLSSPASAELTSSEVLRQAKQRGGIVVARSPVAWDLPVWLASGELDAIQLIDGHSLRAGVADDKNNRPRDESLYPGATGYGRWCEAVYYHVLNCGLRIPPVAGSGSGTNESPLGTNRVYVYCGDDFSYEHWWEGLVAGRVFITNGPLLRPMVEGRLPGHVFHLDREKPISLEIGLNLATRVPIEYLQIVKNGTITSDVRLDEFAQSGGRLPPIEFEESGWFSVRAVTTDSAKHQFATSGPFYVEKSGRPRVSRRSAQFFLDWISAAEQRLRGDRKLTAAARDKLLAEQQIARDFFERLLATASAE